MAWPKSTQFKAVERLPVPGPVHEAFKKVQSAEVGMGYAGGKGMEARVKAAAKHTAAQAEAAAHFGGDVGKTTTHYKRWQRWKGAAMSPAGLAEEVVGRTLQNMGVDKEPMYEKMRNEKRPRLTRPVRRSI